MNRNIYVERVSKCCRAAVFHPKPIGSRRLSDALMIACSECGKTTTIVLLDMWDRTAWEAPPDEDEI